MIYVSDDNAIGVVRVHTHVLEEREMKELTIVVGPQTYSHLYFSDVIV